MLNLSWIKNLNNPEHHLEGDTRLIAEECGIESFIKLYEIFNKTSVNFSESHLKELKKQYVREYFNGNNAKLIARKLGVSQRFVYEILNEKVKGSEKAT